MKKTTLALLLAMFAMHGAQARIKAVPSRTDPHFQSVPYSNEIVEIVVRQGKFVEIQFGPNDTDLHYGMGDKEAWTVKVADNVFAFKAKASFADTNLKIWSAKTKRVYWFSIVMAQKKDTPDLWHLDIEYPPEPPKPAKPPAPPDPQVVAIRLAEKEHADVESLLTPVAAAPAPVQDDDPRMAILNGNYGIMGPEELTPTSVYDNGEETVLTFAANQPMPTIFLKESDGSESRVSKHVENDMLVVHMVGRKFVLRRNGQAACLINGSFNPTGPNRKTNTVSNAVIRELKKDE
jgi:type IV secretion system protein VirB9